MGLTAERLMPTERGPRYYEHIKRYQFAAKQANGKKILDVACGSGYGAGILIEGGASKVVGVDLSEEAINYAKVNFGSKHAHFRVGDATALKLGAGTFDMVVSFETLEHIPDYRKFLAETYRVLRKGGSLMVSTPNVVTFGGNLKKPFIKYHIKEFTLAEFKSLLIQAGYRIENVYGQTVNGKLRWIYTLRYIATRIPFGITLLKKYQDSIVRSNKKPDDVMVNRLLGLIGIRYSIEDVLINNDPINGIYFIAECKKM